MTETKKEQDSAETAGSLLVFVLLCFNDQLIILRTNTSVNKSPL